MSAVNCFLACAVGLRLRRFFFCFPIGITSNLTRICFCSPFLIIIIYLCEYIFKMEYCTNILV